MVNLHIPNGHSGEKTSDNDGGNTDIDIPNLSGNPVSFAYPFSFSSTVTQAKPQVKSAITDDGNNGEYL